MSQVHQSLLAERGLAATTIATMLVKMEKKGVVTHRLEGRRYIYLPTASEDEVRRTMVDEITERLFEGSAVALVSHLLEQYEVKPKELEELRALIDDQEIKESES